MNVVYSWLLYLKIGGYALLALKRRVINHFPCLLRIEKMSYSKERLGQFLW